MLLLVVYGTLLRARLQKMQKRLAKQDHIRRIFCILHRTGFEVPTSCTQNEKILLVVYGTLLHARLQKMQKRLAKQDHIRRIFCILHRTGFEVPTSCTQNEKKVTVSLLASLCSVYLSEFYLPISKVRWHNF
jgi:hypothetical protein